MFVNGGFTPLLVHSVRLIPSTVLRHGRSTRAVREFSSFVRGKIPLRFDDRTPFSDLQDARAKNSAVDSVNYIFQFLFQELKDSSRLRRYLMHKLDTEFKELQKNRTGKFFIQNIVVRTAIDSIRLRRSIDQHFRSKVFPLEINVPSSTIFAWKSRRETNEVESK